jgi:hypothetical protein
MPRSGVRPRVVQVESVSCLDIRRGASHRGLLASAVEEGLFFPTWSTEGDVPAGQVIGALVEDDRCLYVEANDQRTLVVWEDGMGFDDGTLIDASGSPVAGVGEVIHGGGGYYDSQSHIEDLSGESIPERCIPDRA